MAGEKFKQFPWVAKLLTEEEVQSIASEIERAEKSTSGEIVTMIVKQSSTAGYLPMMITLLLMLILLVFEVPSLPLFKGQYYWVLFFIAALSFLISIPLSKMTEVKRLLIPVGDQIFQVEERALLEFHQLGMKATRARTGILIFVSILERRVVVLADQGISSKLPAETWTQLCQNLVKSIKEKKTADGLKKAIEESGRILSLHFPIQHDNPNELQDHLIIKD